MHSSLQEKEGGIIELITKERKQPMEKTKIVSILYFAGIIILPYGFILLMGMLEKAGIISSSYSFLIVLAALAIMAGMAVLAVRNYKKTK